MFRLPVRIEPEHGSVMRRLSGFAQKVKLFKACKSCDVSARSHNLFVGSSLLRTPAILFLWALGVVCSAPAQITQPLVAVHDSELTRALEAMPAVAPTPTGAGTTSNQWWT